VVVISFHSLEDRLVKLAMASWRQERKALVLTRHVVRPDEEAVRRNPRSRSAKLRAAAKLEDPAAGFGDNAGSGLVR
jgi:16S rRNA (cytosine1402-N4)-methyltransferase